MDICRLPRNRLSRIAHTPPSRCLLRISPTTQAQVPLPANLHTWVNQGHMPRLISLSKLSCAQGKCARMATCCNCSSQSEHATVGDGVIFLLYKREQRRISRLSRTFTEEIKILRTWLGEVPALPQLQGYSSQVSIVALSAWVLLNKVKFCRIFLRFALGRKERELETDRGISTP